MLQIRRSLAAIAMVVGLAVLTASPALANGIGDLYVATKGGVDEFHVSTAELVNRVPVTPRPEALAFTPDGHKLYAGGAGSRVVRIDIETLEVDQEVDVDGPVAALAHPRGERLVVARADRGTLALVTHEGDLVESAALPGRPTLLAGDRREDRVVAAAVGKTWLAVLDPRDRGIRTATAPGPIAALAVDRDRGAVFVAIHGPDRLLRYDLDDLSIDRAVDLEAAPVGIAVLTDGPIVAAGGLWRVGTERGTRFGPLSGVGRVAATDDGRAVFAVLPDGVIVALDTRGAVVGTIRLAADAQSAGLAPVPGRSSLVAGSAATPPRTDTVRALGRVPPGTRGLPLAALAGAALVLSALAIGSALVRSRARGSSGPSR